VIHGRPKWFFVCLRRFVKATDPFNELERGISSAVTGESKHFDISVAQNESFNQSTDMLTPSTSVENRRKVITESRGVIDCKRPLATLIFPIDI
jgi:hypothetical protein